jgi:hypothetical protein
MPRAMPESRLTVTRSGRGQVVVDRAMTARRALEDEADSEAESAARGGGSLAGSGPAAGAPWPQPTAPPAPARSAAARAPGKQPPASRLWRWEPGST